MTLVKQLLALRMRHLLILSSFIAMLVLVAGCRSSTHSDIDSHHNKSYVNTLPEGGIKSRYTPKQGFMNLEAMKESLDRYERAIFDKSISWYATESEFSFTKIDAKTAKEIVDIVNCLKAKRSTSIANRATCF